MTGPWVWPRAGHYHSDLGEGSLVDCISWKPNCRGSSEELGERKSRQQEEAACSKRLEVKGRIEIG